MALSAPVLSAAIKAELLAPGNEAAGAVDGEALDALCDAIATAVVAHVLTAVVQTVTACPAGAGTGTGVLT